MEACPPGPRILSLTVGPIQSNCYLVAPAGGSEAIIIDPGAEAERIDSALAEWGVAPAAILLTHAHMDHLGAVAELRDRHPAAIYLHPADLPLYERAVEQGAAFGIPIRPPPPPDRVLFDGQTLALAGLSFEVRHAPGHSPGGVVFVLSTDAFVGDCVFAGSIGRTDLPGGDAGNLLDSIRRQILSLPPATRLHCGHGPSTTVSREMASNPFLAGMVGKGE
ncbi:MAG: MBL fold metallo-hydrolase [Gemmatimonadota bacterium]